MEWGIHCMKPALYLIGMRSWSLTKYTTRNWLSYNTALKQRGSLSIWFDPEMSWRAFATGKRGRQPEFIQAAIHVCLTMKVLFGVPLRRMARFVESLLRLAGRDRKVPGLHPPGNRREPARGAWSDLSPAWRLVLRPQGRQDQPCHNIPQLRRPDQ